MGSWTWVKPSIKTQTAVLSSVSDRKGLNPKDRSKTVVDSSLALVKSLLMPFTAPTDPVVHHGSLTGLSINCQ